MVLTTSLRRALLVFLLLPGLNPKLTASETFPGRSAIPSEALLGSPWVTPPRSAEETAATVAQLRQQYAPFLRSLPKPLEGRPRQSLDGEWLARFEVTTSETGARLPAPQWHGRDEEPVNWQQVTVPEWRWDGIRRPGQWQPWYPASLILWYKRDFEAERPKAGQRVFLCFDGVDWEAEVWLNGRMLGSNVGYFKPFRFDVTDLLREKNTVAVRVFEGPAYGEPIAQWSILPFSPSDKGDNQFYVFGEPEKSIAGFKRGGNSSGGSGFGIHRSVYLETVDATHVGAILARGYPSKGTARIVVETESVAARPVGIEVEVLPENFDGGTTYTASRQVEAGAGTTAHEFVIPAPESKTWWPATPHLYRARVTVRDGDRILDRRDALFGFREATLVSPTAPREGLSDGMLLLNGLPVFLRGTSVGGSHNLAIYNQTPEQIVDICLLLKASNFNVVRNNQHVAFPEVIEIFDRLGILNQQEQGSGYEAADHKVKPGHLAKVVAPLARLLYNHPSVIFISFMNEAHLDMTEPIAAVLKQDPERLLVPISGALFALREPSYADNLLGSFHRYDAWYSGVDLIWSSGDPWRKDRNVMLDYKDKNPKPPATFFPVMRPQRMAIVGEYGAEALDNYETMKKYPAWWGETPALTDDDLWGAIQVAKADLRQIFGFRGKKPSNLGEYIEASQTFMEDILAECTKGYRLSNDTLLGYYQYFFSDLSPANWPKSVLGFDLSPKKGFFEMAQLNQPVVPLYRLVGDDLGAMEIWVSNDLIVKFPGAQVAWSVAVGDKTLEGTFRGDIPATSSTRLGEIPLTALPAGPQVLDVRLTLSDSKGRAISEYRRHVYRSLKEVEESRRSAAERAAVRARIEKERQQFIPEVATQELERKLLEEKKP